MGFFKRMLSMGSKRGKKKDTSASKSGTVPPVPTYTAAQEEDRVQEAAMTRLLRASSARYAVVTELDYSNMPPMPHPINTVVHTPAASTTSLNSTVQRGTYTVTVHKRKQPERVETPEVPHLPAPESPENTSNLRDSSQLIKLRADPSVASLLNMYDERGQIPPQAFSNAPSAIKEEKREQERAQTRRNGSTLRQLLGDPAGLAVPRRPVDFSIAEGDISWAERYLRESDLNSSTSSLGLPTPNDFDAHFPNDIHHETSFSTDYDISTNVYDNPAISSMEVEVSMGADSSISEPKYPYPSLASDNYQTATAEPVTPQRASDVFGFLTERRRSRLCEDDERELPQLPSAFSSPSDRNHSLPHADAAPRSYFSSDSAESNSSLCSSSMVSDTSAKPHSATAEAQSLAHFQFPLLHAREQSDRTAMARSRAASSEPTLGYQTPPATEAKPRTLVNRRSQVVVDTASAQVIVTAPTPSDPRITCPAPSRIPRGPRMPHTKSEGQSSRPTLGERSNSSGNSNSGLMDDRFTPLPIPSRRRASRRASTSSSTFPAADSSNSFELEPAVVVVRSKREGQLILPAPDKENTPDSSLEHKPARHSSLLATTFTSTTTPVRAKTMTSSQQQQLFAADTPSNAEATLFRSMISRNATVSMFDAPRGMTPSPASSSEMSPVGQKLMMDLRQQRMKAREAERRRSRSGAPGGRFGSRS